MSIHSFTTNTIKSNTLHHTNHHFYPLLTHPIPSHQTTTPFHSKNTQTFKPQNLVTSPIHPPPFPHFVARRNPLLHLPAKQSSLPPSNHHPIRPSLSHLLLHVAMEQHLLSRCEHFLLVCEACAKLPPNCLAIGIVLNSWVHGMCV